MTQNKVKSEMGNYDVVTEEEKSEIVSEMAKLLDEYDYEYTDRALCTIVDTWAENKESLIRLFKKHPNYNGKFQIVFSSSYDRAIDTYTLSWFYEWLDSVGLYDTEKLGIHESLIIEGFTYNEVYAVIQNIYMTLAEKNLFIPTYSLAAIKAYLDSIDDIEFKVLGAKYIRYNNLLAQFRGRRKTKEYDLYCQRVGSWIKSKEQFINEKEAKEINELIPQMKVNTGMKRSRVVNKLAKLLGIDKAPEYNSRFAQYSDAINPLAIVRHTILSINPIDYLTMSFGNSWASCHTIDKKNVRCMPESYSGCYSSGTVSYMLDEVSSVFYTIDKSYDGNCFELEPKINRCMFHYNDGILIQGRVYPQCNDGEGGIYQKIREIVQKIFADMLEQNNLWLCKKGTSAISPYVYSEGTHYRDYLSYDSCNISFIKDGDEYCTDRSKMTIGRDPISVYSGKEHYNAENIMGDECEHSCCGCGQVLDEGDMHYIDGDWYCEECCFYCEYHEEWEIGDGTYVEDYGEVCDYALEWGDFICCEECGDWYHKDNMSATVDVGYICDRCADRYYTWISSLGLYAKNEEVGYCENCDEAFLLDDLDEDGYCDGCRSYMNKGDEEIA